MTPPRHADIEQAVALAQGAPGIPRLLAEMLASISGTVAGNETLHTASRRVLDRLTEGPLHPHDWPGIASSERALYVLIARLRTEGVGIVKDGESWTLETQAIAA